MIAKNILIKTILLGLIFSLISFNNLIAKSRYWSTKKVVSTNQLEIINKYFKKRMDLNPIEGIWLQEGYGTIAIIKDPSLKMLYRKYIIESFEDPSLNGTMDGTFTRTKAFDKYAIFEKKKIKKNDNYEFITVLGKGILYNKNKASPKMEGIKEWRELMGNDKNRNKFRDFLKEAKNLDVLITSSLKEKNLNIKYSLIRIFPKF